MNIYWVVLAATYLGVQSATFVECHPFSLYWKVVPDPGTSQSLLTEFYRDDLIRIIGTCTHALIQLIVFVAFNILTDVMLIVLPMPYLIRMKRPLKKYAYYVPH
jgi:hypothetical protein